MPADPLERLERLAPHVDEGRVWTDLRRRNRRRRRTLRLVSAATVAVVAASGALLLTGDDDATMVSAVDDPTTSVTEPTDPTGPTEPVEGITAVATANGIEITVSLPGGQVTVGTRIDATVSIRNVGSTPVYWAHGGCPDPASVTLVPSGTDPVYVPTEQWDGSSSLTDWLAEHDPVLPVQFVEPGAIGYSMQGCTLQLIFETIEPGASISWTGEADVRVPDGPLADDLVASFGGFDDPADYPDSPRPLVTARVAVPLVDEPGRAAGTEAAIEAFAAAPELAAFLDRTGHQFDDNPIPVTQTWSTELFWWDGAWELRVHPYFSDGPVPFLRLRYSPADGSLSIDEPTSLDRLGPGD
jgi:hypothetical protein